MTADQYRAALLDLGLSQVGAAIVLGVASRTSQAYAAHGPSAPAALAIQLLLSLPPAERAPWLAK